MKNRYPGTCIKCGERVEKNGGDAFKQRGRWVVCHEVDENGSCIEQPAAVARPVQLIRLTDEQQKIVDARSRR